MRLRRSLNILGRVSQEPPPFDFSNPTLSTRRVNYNEFRGFSTAITFRPPIVGLQGLRQSLIILEDRTSWKSPESKSVLVGGGHRSSTRLFSTKKPKSTDEDAAKERREAEERSNRFESNEDFLQNRALSPKKLSWNAVARAIAGNTVITVLKFGVFIQTGSSAMLSEAVHTLADCGNQLLLLKGLQQASQTPDKRYQYGYGKASFFWALVSALGMFWTGAGVSFGHGLYTLIHPPQLFEVSSEMLGVLLTSFLVDGFVLAKTVKEVIKSKPANVSLATHFGNIRDPFVLVVLFEDAAACTGVAFAATGIYLSQINGDVSYDTLAGISVGLLLASVAVKLVQINHQFLIGQAVDDEIIADIRSILRNRPGINAVYDVQSQWVGPHAFSFKAECDFNGYELARKLQDLYSPLFLEVLKKSAPESAKKQELDTIMAWMCEDVTRLIEQEIKEVETIIRMRHPMAAFIELEPDSRKTFLRAYDGKAWQESEMSKASTLLLQRRDSSIFGYFTDSSSTEIPIESDEQPDRTRDTRKQEHQNTIEEQAKREATKVVTSLLLQKQLGDLQSKKDENKKN